MDTRHHHASHKGFAFSGRLLAAALALVALHSPLCQLWSGQPQQVAANPAAVMSMSSAMVTGNTALAGSAQNLKSRVPAFAANGNLGGQSTGFRSKASLDSLSSQSLNSGWDTSLTPIRSSLAQNIYDISAQNSILAEVSASFELNAPDCYNSLLDRFDNWQQKFKKLNLTTGQVANSQDSLIREAFRQAGSELEREDCAGGGGAGSFDGHSSGANGDFIYKLFKKAVEMMDSFLANFNQIKEQYQNLMDLKDIMQNEIQQPSPETRIKMLESIKNKTIQYAKKQLKIQLNKHATQMGINYLSNLLVHKFGYPDNPQDYLVPIAQAIQSDSLNKVAEILSDVQFRGAIGLINSKNPMPFTECKSEQDTKGPQC